MQLGPVGVRRQVQAIVQRPDAVTPEVLLHGAQDRVPPPAHSRQAAMLVPGAELVLWPDCGHTPQLEQPDDFNRLLVRLAAQVSQGAQAEAPQG